MEYTYQFVACPFCPKITRIRIRSEQQGERVRVTCKDKKCGRKFLVKIEAEKEL